LNGKQTGSCNFYLLSIFKFNMKRREFIHSGLAASTGPWLPDLSMAERFPTKLKIKILATNWGYDGTIDSFCKKIKAAGYDGLEIWWPTQESERAELATALAKYQLEIGFLTAGGGSSFSEHLSSFQKNLVEASTLFPVKPLYINLHSGKDHFSFEQNADLIQFSIQQAKASGIKILHETHRGRMCYSAPITRRFLEAFPAMQLTLDISHWTNVHESMLDDQKQTIDLALLHTRHIHSRVGHAEGPQVNDPRAPEWEFALKKHLSWWDQVLTNLEKTGASELTFLTEFGPIDYLPALPYTRQPVADQWAINLFMLHLLRERYQTL
jgi:sugar phosphate isomerase/epimerase